MLTGNELIHDIDSRCPSRGDLYFWWLGQHSFIVKTSNSVLYLDPFLTKLPGRQIPPLLKPSQVTNATMIFGSHDHDDHIDRPALPIIMETSPNATLVVPHVVQKSLVDQGFPKDRVSGIDHAESLTISGVRITAIKAAHEFFDYDSDLGYPYLGFIIETDGVTLYHSGDTCIYDGLATYLNQWEITVAFLPINGRDAKRLRENCIGNMTYQEAVDLAGAVEPCLTVASHYEMFANNMENPMLFTEYMDIKFPGLPYWIGEHGTAVRVGAC